MGRSLPKACPSCSSLQSFASKLAGRYSLAAGADATFFCGAVPQ